MIKLKLSYVEGIVNFHITFINYLLNKNEILNIIVNFNFNFNVIY